MELNIKIYGHYCSTEIFLINGKSADTGDFGNIRDASPETAEEYGCGNRKFSRIPATQEVLEKYEINEEEYSQIAEKLEEELSFGRCGWCV